MIIKKSSLGVPQGFFYFYRPNKEKTIMIIKMKKDSTKKQYQKLADFLESKKFRNKRCEQ